MTWVIDMPFVGRWMLTLGVSTLLLLLASMYRRRIGPPSSPTQEALNAAGHMLAYLLLTLLWMWTLEPIQVEIVRLFMSLALALGLGSLLYVRPAAGQHRQISAVNSAGILLGILTMVVLVSY